MIQGALERGLERLRSLWHHMAGGEAPSPQLGPKARDELRRTLAECVAEVGGEVSARQRAASLGERYLALDTEGRRDFLRILAEEFGPDTARARQAAEVWLAAADPHARRQGLHDLRKALKSPRQQVLMQFNALPQGVHFLVRLREDLLDLMRTEKSLSLFDAELQEMLASWFDVGFLELQRISWQSSAALLEKLVAYEAVHAIRSWRDLRNRLDSDRRCYAFFHPRMPDEPLIFVEVALVKSLAGSVQLLLDENQPTTPPEEANTAIFYSISNTQRGLRGISFGNFLIKRVVEELKRELPQLKTFATLSPLPGFMAWLEEILHQDAALDEAALHRLAAVGVEGGAGLLVRLKAGDWAADEALSNTLRPIMGDLCARYLVGTRRGDGLPVDPVARFHLGNGARLERLNWLGDASERGMRQSAGWMVNYLYDLERIEANHEAYAGKQEIVASAEVRRWLRQSG